jgi:hypothetical protein
MSRRSIQLLGRCAIIAGSLLLGCATHGPDRPPASALSRHDRYARADLDELLTFGSHLSEMTEAQQTGICHDMLKYERDPASAGGGLVLHQLLGRLYSDECGDIKSLVTRLESFPMESLPDVQTRQLVTMQTALLRRQSPLVATPTPPRRQHQHPLRKTGEATPKTSAKSQPAPSSPRRSSPVSGPGKSPPPAAAATGQGDDQLLRQKLEALREMERKLDDADVGR